MIVLFFNNEAQLESSLARRNMLEGYWGISENPSKWTIRLQREKKRKRMVGISCSRDLSKRVYGSFFLSLQHSPQTWVRWVSLLDQSAFHTLSHVLEPDLYFSQEPNIKFSGILWINFYIIGNFKSAIVVVNTAWELTNATNWGFLNFLGQMV